MPNRYYTTYSCPHCSSKLARVQGYGYHVEKPFVSCPTCGQLVLMTSLRNEWELMSLGAKRFMYIRCVLQPIYYVGFPAPVYYSILGAKMNPYVFGVLLVSVILIWAYLNIRGLRALIAESKKRMSSPEYRSLLRQMGIIK